MQKTSRYCDPDPQVKLSKDCSIRITPCSYKHHGEMKLLETGDMIPDNNDTNTDTYSIDAWFLASLIR